MRTRRAATAFAAACATAASGCAGFVNDQEQWIEITSHPEGATVTILPDGILATTPARVALARRHVHTVFFELAGHCRETAYLDRVTSPAVYLLALEPQRRRGLAHRLAPNPLEVALRPEHGAAECPR